jgi:hypothetical protein
MDAALAFLNGACTKRPRSRRAAQKLLTLINALCGLQPASHSVPSRPSPARPKTARPGLEIRQTS